MGQITDGLNGPFKVFVVDLVQQQRQNDTGWEGKNYGIQANKQSVDKGPQKVGAGKEGLKVGQASPGAVGYPKSGREILKRDLNAVNWNVAENNVIGQYWYQH